MNRTHLTGKQHAFLEFLIERVCETGRWPTYREIADHFGYRSPNSVTQNLKALRKKGILTKDAQGFHLADHVLPDQEAGIPIRGIIAAGQLQEAVEANLGAITLERLFPNLERLFALRISGASMQEAGLHDGDYVLLIDGAVPEGGIGAVLYDGQTSLKRVYYEADGLRLEPANDAYDALRITPGEDEEVTILGRYAGHLNEHGLFKRDDGSPRRRG